MIKRPACRRTRQRNSSKEDYHVKFHQPHPYPYHTRHSYRHHPGDDLHPPRLHQNHGSGDHPPAHSRHPRRGPYRPRRRHGAGCSVWLHQLLSVLRPKHLRHHPVQHQSRWHLYRLRDPPCPAGTGCRLHLPRLRSPHRQVERHHHRCTGHHLPYGNVHGHAGDLLLHQ